MRALIFVSALAVLAVARPDGAPPSDLAGHWVADPVRSDFGRMPPPLRLSDHIEYHGRELLIVSAMEPRGGRRLTSTMRLVANGEDTVAMINGSRFLTRCWWDRNRLIIRLTDSRGVRMTEVRSLSKDRAEMTVESYLGDVAGRPLQRRVMRHLPQV